MRQPILTLALSVFITSSLGATALSAQAHDHDAAAGDAMVIEVDMADHSFTPATLRIPAGHPVTLVFENTGSVEHEFMAGRGVSDGDFDVDLFAGLEVVIGTAEMAVHDGDAGHDHAAGAADHVDPPGAPAHDHADAADAGGHEHGGDDHGTMVGLDAGGRTTMTFTLPADRRGEWEMACFLPRHYDRGMHGMLTVY
ncbi:MAG: cupredoxin domain-containing protein [Gemmatimonadota bacterium]|nr:cupredoxin domain-containing protein [Gemmatimonadota bacterium]MDH3424128.1 cupredoxin domain-containing protein [Gemmatimonadota bacterium]